MRSLVLIFSLLFSLGANAQEVLKDGDFEGGFYGTVPNVSASGVVGPWQWKADPPQFGPIVRGFSQPPWTVYGAIPVIARTGNYLAFFSPPANGYSQIYQKVYIPSVMTPTPGPGVVIDGGQATLTFWLNIKSVGGGHAPDTFYVRLYDSTATTYLATIATFTDRDITGTWAKYTYDVSRFSGQKVVLQFVSGGGLYGLNTGETVFMLDDVSLMVTSPFGPCVADADTLCLVNGRYKVTSHWKNQYAGGEESVLSAAFLTNTTGAFWRYDSDRYEYFINFNPQSNNGRMWVSISTLTSVEFWVDVTDTVSGRAKEFHSPAGLDPFNTVNIWDPYFFVYP